jgi:hypothetical protein
MNTWCHNSRRKLISINNRHEILKPWDLFWSDLQIFSIGPFASRSYSGVGKINLTDVYQYSLSFCWVFKNVVLGTVTTCCCWGWLRLEKVRSPLWTGWYRTARTEISGLNLQAVKSVANTNFFTFNIVAKMWTDKEKFISVHLKVEADITTWKTSTKPKLL